MQIPALVLAAALSSGNPTMPSEGERDTFSLKDAVWSTVVQLVQKESAVSEKNRTDSIWHDPISDFWVIAPGERVTIAQETDGNIKSMEQGTAVTEENIVEEALRQWGEQMDRILTNLQRTPGTKVWWKAFIELLAIINFFTILPWAYRQTINGAKKGSGAAPITFAAFTASNFLGMSASFVSWAPFLGLGYAIAFVSAIQTVRALSARKILNMDQKQELDEAKKQIQELTHRLDLINGWLSIDDPTTWENFQIPFELIKQHAALSVYNGEGRPVFFTDSLLRTLGYAKEEINVYYEEHGEIVSLLYPDESERERVQNFLSGLANAKTGYTATFYPIARDNAHLAIEFRTEPIFDAEWRFNGTARFARDVTGEHLAKKSLEIDMLTGESNRHGFEAYFNKLVRRFRERRGSSDAFPKNIVLAFGDLDFFKKVNDTYGHANADILLRELAARFREKLRSEDCVARLWWDEFGIICEWASKEDIVWKLSKVRNDFSSTIFEIENGRLTGVERCESKSQAEAKAGIKNKWIDATRCYIGWVSFSMGVVDSITMGIEDESDIQWLRHELEQQSEIALSHIKHLGNIFPEYVSKNAVAYPEFDTNGKLLKVVILYHTGETSTIEWEELLRDASEKIQLSIQGGR